MKSFKIDSIDFTVLANDNNVRDFFMILPLYKLNSHIPAEKYNAVIKVDYNDIENTKLRMTYFSLSKRQNYSHKLFLLSNNVEYLIHFTQKLQNLISLTSQINNYLLSGSRYPHYYYTYTFRIF